MVRSEYKYHTLGVWVFDFAQHDGKGGQKVGIPYRMFVAGEAPVARLTTGSALALSSPQETKTEAERENTEVVGKEGAAAPAGLELQPGQGSVDAGALAGGAKGEGSRGRRRPQQTPSGPKAEPFDRFRGIEGKALRNFKFFILAYNKSKINY
jgi:hypothetical protein